MDDEASLRRLRSLLSSLVPIKVYLTTRLRTSYLRTVRRDRYESIAAVTAGELLVVEVCAMVVDRKEMVHVWKEGFIYDRRFANMYTLHAHKLQGNTRVSSQIRTSKETSNNITINTLNTCASLNYVHILLSRLLSKRAKIRSPARLTYMPLVSLTYHTELPMNHLQTPCHAAHADNTMLTLALPNGNNVNKYWVSLEVELQF